MKRDKEIEIKRKAHSAREIINPVLLAALGALALAGCKTAARPASAVKAPQPRGAIERQLASLMGADLSAAVGILGFPDERRQTGSGLWAYVWSSGRSSRLPMTEIRMGSYDTEAGGGSSPCKIELTADDNGRVAGYTWSGTQGDCAWVRQAFKRAASADASR